MRWFFVTKKLCKSKPLMKNRKHRLSSRCDIVQHLCTTAKGRKNKQVSHCHRKKNPSFLTLKWMAGRSLRMVTYKSYKHPESAWLWYPTLHMARHLSIKKPCPTWGGAFPYLPCPTSNPSPNDHKVIAAAQSKKGRTPNKTKPPSPSFS